MYSPTNPLPPELWKIILEEVMRDDIHNENNDDSSNCRLVCRQWESLIDGSNLRPLVPTWNPYFNTHVHEEGISGFATTVGTHFSTGSDVEAFLSQWDTEDHPYPTPFVKETLIVEWRSNGDYIQVLDLLPAVFDRFGSYIHHLKMSFDPSLPKSVECLILTCSKKLANLRSISIFVCGANAEELLRQWLALDVNSEVQSGALQHLTEVSTVGPERESEAYDKLFELFGTAAGGGGNVKRLRIWSHLNIWTTRISQHFPNVNTLKVCGSANFTTSPLEGLYIVGSNAVTHVRRENYNIFKLGEWKKLRRLSVKFTGRQLTNEYLYNIFFLASALGETLEEFYVDFVKCASRLEDEVPIPLDMDRILRESPFNLLTKLCLPYVMMTEHLAIVRRLTGTCTKLEHLKLVHSEGFLQEGNNEALRKEEVREAVQRAWEYVPPTVKWISVKFRKLNTDTATTNRRIMTNVVWRYERLENHQEVE